MSFFLVYAQDVLSLDTSVALRESAELLQKLLLLCANATNPWAFSDRMSVSKLRKELALLGLSVDGSKEVLKKRLDEALDGDDSEYDSYSSGESESDDEFTFDSEEDTLDEILMSS